jgi:hypothetical protein
MAMLNNQMDDGADENGRDESKEVDKFLVSGGLDEADKTDETDETDSNEIFVSNDVFIKAIFGNVNKDSPHKPLVCSISGDPNKNKGWRPISWPCYTSDPEKNWYACPSLFEPSKDGTYKAQKGLAHSVYCMMLDDIGTKIPVEKIKNKKVTWQVETSPGNFQVGFKFKEPIDVRTARELKQAFIDAELCDKGSSGAAVRWMRMPHAINGKAEYGTPAPRCRMRVWNPEHQVTVEELVRQFNLKIIIPTKSNTQKSTSTIFGPSNSPGFIGVYEPKPKENCVVTALKYQGFYKASIGNGRHDITCPWVTEHTNHIDHGSCYFEPSNEYPLGGFKCQHSHGDLYKISKLLDFLDITEIAAKNKSIITAVAGEFSRIVEAAEIEIASTNQYFQSGGGIVSVHRDPKTKQTVVKPLTQPGLAMLLSKLCIWFRFNRSSRSYEVCDPPARHITSLFDAEYYLHLKSLTGVARQPYLRSDGSLVTTPGYDDQSGIYGDFDPKKYSCIVKPTKEDAMYALGVLRGLLNEFAFSNPCDETAALAAILTATTRPSLATAPMFHIKAPQIASGKSYLASVIATFAGAMGTTAYSFPENDEECRKLLLAAFLESPAVINFDNVTTDIQPYKSLCSAVTEEFLTGRVLGLSKTATVGTRTLLLSSGNNVDPIKDMARRIIVINLDPKIEAPATRTFARDPLRDLSELREYYVSQALILIRAWLVSETPHIECKRVASFSQWSDWVRQALLWLDLPDPVASLYQKMNNDPDRELLGRFLRSWKSVIGSSPTMIRDALTTLEIYMDLSADPDTLELNECIRDISGDRMGINRRKLGHWISRHEGQIVDGLRFEKAEGHTSAEKWMVKSV